MFKITGRPQYKLSVGKDHQLGRTQAKVFATW